MNKAFFTSLALAALVCFGPGLARAEEPSAAPVPAMGAVQEPTVAEHASAPAAGHEARAEKIQEETSGESESGAEHVAFSGKTFALQLINFSVLLFLLVWFGGRSMNKALRAKHEQLKAEIDAAARQRDEAKRAYEAQEQRMASIEKEVAALRASMRADAEREQAALLAGAQERARKIQDDVRFQLDQQVKEAEAALRAEVASASVKLAEELLRKSVSPDDQRRLAREFVVGVDGAQESPEGGR
jgi:F-type H+-transporting ATPase subunit b